MNNLPIGTLITPNGLLSGLWAMPRPTTHRWGSGAVLSRIEEIWGCDIIFGKTDQVSGITVDKNPGVNPTFVADWVDMSFAGDDEYGVGYWDPPYLGYIGPEGDVHYSRLEPCLREICRILSDKLFILSPLIYPCPKGWKRIAVIAITFGPNKIIRCLQGFQKQ